MPALFVKQLTVIDFSYYCATRGLVGESWLVDVILDGQLNEEGMVFDFGQVKKTIKQTIDDFVDHKLLVPGTHPAINIAAEHGRMNVTLSTENRGKIICDAPSSAIITIDASEISPSTITPVIEQHLKQVLPDNVENITLKLYPEIINGSFYHYSHGLKKHKGCCQRIAHGHRSAINIYRNGEPDPLLEADYANQFRDIYIGTKEDITGEFIDNDMAYFKFAYTAQQGYFELVISQPHCYLIDSDSTVELIAQHIANTIKTAYPNDKITVNAFEGFKKGAIAEL
ncbi:6-pyruvoyl trahydropterin synthase family protein [Spartinivicinus poritis]|uniref:6-carboxy-5,6,7,8-tetrahydropterin synthase n=1 Tax=Spartinivicinus poritis TaxID=2994640 RepID=A0ABT5U907_9GAMM|nr:6-carboxytetrahydropterin synthase [Spartinivicinus sp. A2-2]MDE1462848.1 6-carboxytetrahydropterin synthase [Spartinivicinus sp. A2-2]